MRKGKEDDGKREEQEEQKMGIRKEDEDEG